MKKTVAIFLLAITLYNTGGYLLIFQYLIYRSDVVAEQKIGKDMYNPSDLVEIKIPVHMPGVGNWYGYQNVGGTVQLQQNSYNYVRMKITTDTIFVMCIPNCKTTNLIKGNVICAREISEAPFNTKKQSAPVKSVNIVSHMIAESAIAAPPSYKISVLQIALTNAKPVAGVYNISAEPPETFLS